MEHYIQIFCCCTTTARQTNAENHLLMKTGTLSFERILLALFLIVGSYGAFTVLQQKEEVSPGIASPRQDAPAMVMTTSPADSEVASWPN